MPIWVGLQAPCYARTASKMSWNTTTAYSQGQDAAVNAYNKITSLQMNTNTPIALDMEGFNTADSACMAAVKAFVRGWTAQLHLAPAQVAGYYGSASGSAPSTMWTLSPHPDFAWAAWQSSPINSHPFDMDKYISDSIWPKRHRQYHLDTTVTSNGVTLSVDKDCADGPMYAGSDIGSASSSCP